MKIAIVGTGGVGGYFGGKLALSGNDVTFLARGEHYQAILKHGLQIKSVSGDFRVYPAKVTSRLEDLGQPDLVVVSVKAWQVRELAKEIKPLLDADSLVLPLQNGVMAAEELAMEIDPGYILGGLCRIFSMIESPGVIKHFGLDPVIVFGELNNSNSDRIQRIKRMFDEAGFTSIVTTDIQTELWKKFILICVGGILALTRSNYGEILAVPQIKELILQLLTEIYTVSVKAGAHVESDYVQKCMHYILTYSKETTTSMARDIWEGKPSELEYQNGTVVKLGKKYGVETPVNKFIYTCLLPMEMKARKILTF